MNQKNSLNPNSRAQNSAMAGNPLQDQEVVRPSVLKKNELPLIIGGALLVTMVVFFLFFRSSGSDDASHAAAKETIAKLEQKIEALETTIAEMKGAQDSGEQGPGMSSDVLKKDLARMEHNLDRMETSVTLKMDSLIGRMADLESRLKSIKTAPEPVKAAPVKKPVATAKSPEKKAAAPPVKKAAVAKPAKKDMFHTVKKGDTLWSISQKYKTTVPAILKLNQMAPGDPIYPGTNLLIR